MARRCAGRLEQEAGRVHYGRAHDRAGAGEVSRCLRARRRASDDAIAQHLQSERGQLPMRTQEAPVKTARARPDKGDHSTVPSEGRLSGTIYGRRAVTHAGHDMSVCAKRL